MDGTVQDAKLKNVNKDLEHDPGKNTLFSLGLIGSWAGLIFAITATLQRASALAVAVFVLPVLAGYTLICCRAIISHNFNYLRLCAMDTRASSFGVRKYWNKLPVTLCISLLVFLFNFWIGLVVSFILIGGMKKTLTRRLNEEYVEGTRLVTPESLNQKFAPQIVKAGAYFWFGGVHMPVQELFTHMKIMGSSSSGKTQFLRLYMRSAIPLVGSISCEDRAILFDPKSEFYPFLKGLGLPAEAIFILNPFDARASAWDLAADLTRPRDAATLANSLIPEGKDISGGSSGGNSEFFNRAARRIVAGLAKFFIKNAPKKWTLRDLVLGAQSMELVGLLAANDRRLARDIQVLGAGDTGGNVVATLAAAIGEELETIAACMDHHQREGRIFSFKTWFNSSSIMLLGCDRESEATLQPYNNLLVTRFCELATSGQHLGTTYAIFDEVPALGKIGKKLDELARLGRSYRIALTIAFQAYSSLKELYGENTANALIGQCDKSAYLRVVDHDSADWASRQIGRTRKRIFLRGTSLSRSSNPGQWGTGVSRSESEQEQYENEAAVKPEDIMNIAKPDIDDKRGILGYYKVASHSYCHYIESQYMTKMQVADDPLTEGFEAMEDTETIEELRLWEEADLKRLGISTYLHGLDEARLMNLPISEMAALCMEAASLEVREAVTQDTDAVQV